MTIGRIPSVEGGIQPTIVDAKGDLIAGVAADSINRLAVGSNDQVLVADSSTSTGLAWKSYGAQFVAGKNAVINGAFDFWQRGTSITVPTAAYTYTSDRWLVYSTHASGTCTVSQQTFTPGTAPVTGYEGQYFLRIGNASGSSYYELSQKIEDARTFAGQTVTVSFWAKAGSATTLSFLAGQNFGTGGSAQTSTSGTNFSLTTSWQRFSFTLTMPSISGKTVGTGSFVWLYFYYNSGAVASNNIDFWGIQFEAGSVATPFSRAAGTLQGELAACQRYYYAHAVGIRPIGVGTYPTTSQFNAYVNFPVTMRTAPTLSSASGSNFYTIFTFNGTYDYLSSLTLEIASTNVAWIKNTTDATSGANGAGGLLYVENASGFVAFSAEL